MVYQFHEDSLMKRIIGNFLIVFSIICAVLTGLWIRPILIDIPENPSQRIRQQMFYGLLIAVILLALECGMFLYGRYLRRRYPAEVPKQTKIPRGRRLLPLVASLGCSIAITIFILLANKFLEIKALFFVIG
jgi:MFS family permease